MRLVVSHALLVISPEAPVVTVAYVSIFWLRVAAHAT